MIEEFFQTYFIEPIILYQGYNIVNTLVYAIILILVSLFVIFPFLDRRGIKFNLRFMLALFPYILFGISLRIIEDMKILPRSPLPWEPGYYFVSPGIWLLIAITAIAGLFIAAFLSKKFTWDFHKIFGSIGLILWLPVLAFDLMHFVVWDGFLGIIAMAAAVTGAVYLIMKYIKKDFFSNRLNLLAVAGQALDGSATFVATQFFRCGEQHVLSGIIVNFYPLAFVLVKILLIIIILYYIDKEVERENMKGFIKILVIILGFATGLRDLFTVAVGTCL